MPCHAIQSTLCHSAADVEHVTDAVATVSVSTPAEADPAVGGSGGAAAGAEGAATPSGGAGEGDASEIIDDADVEEGVTAPRAGAAMEGDPREHLNVIFIGHVDSGKSTLSGSILYLTGQVDKRTIEKFEREAKERNRDSWFLAYIMDTTDEERAKGITVEVGRATFETEHKRFTVLDAPGHKNYVPNMIAGAAQADVGVLVISARKGEFETGFERGGQTREHALLAKTLGVRVLVVVINKMDEATVQWSKDRWDECVSKITPFLKQSGYNTAKHVHFIPISAMSGANVKDRAPKAMCPYYDGPSLLELLDGLSVAGRDPDGPLRVPVVDRYADRGVISMGKVESGTLRLGQEVLIMPQGLKARVDAVFINDTEVGAAKPGENVKIKLKGVSEDELFRGCVICDRVNPPVPVVTQFEAQLMLLELDHRALFTAGYDGVLHIHTAEEECTIVKLVAELDKRTAEPKPGGPPRFVKSGALCVAIVKVARAIPIEKFEVMQQLGRFTLRDEGRTIAIGKVLRLGVPKPKGGATGGAGGGPAGSA
jgi:peptide chain release factor subunit 3